MRTTYSSSHRGWCWPGPDLPEFSPLGVGLDLIPLNFPLGCGPASDPPQFPPWCGPGGGSPWQRGVSLAGGSPWQGVSLAEGGLLGRGGSPWQGGLPGRGVSLAEGGSPWGGLLLGGCLFPGGSAPWGCIQHALRQTSPVNRITHACKSITLPQLRCGW